MSNASVLDRFWFKVKRDAACWLWTGARTSGGYGQFWNGSAIVYAHRFSYEAHVGRIPDGLVIDHLCLEPVTNGENLRRGISHGGHNNSAKTHCPKGHPYSGGNLYLKPNGTRCCRECNNAAQRARRAAHV
jgi:hypothetical protein